ncbi:MAG: phytanoyl-CoA dioxygenase family protein [Actinomycetota bacterium]
MATPATAPLPGPQYDDELGFCVVPDLLTADEAAAIVTACDHLMSLPSAERDSRDKVASGTRHLEGLDVRIPLVGHVLERPALTEPVAAIVGPTAEAVQAAMRCPHAGFGGQKMHADDVPRAASGPYRVATAIVALTDFTEDNGATRVLPGSHQRLDLQRRSGMLEDHPDEVALTGPVGTAFVFNGHLLHAGRRNDSAAPRPALQLLWRPV